MAVSSPAVVSTPGLATRDHAVPFQCSMRIFGAELLPAYPTAQALLSETAAAPAERAGRAVGRRGGPDGRTRNPSRRISRPGEHTGYAD